MPGQSRKYPSVWEKVQATLAARQARNLQAKQREKARVHMRIQGVNRAAVVSTITSEISVIPDIYV
jgi:hypothetical protein